MAELQQKYIKDDQLIRYMVAQTVTDEMPEPLNLEFHPRPEKSYKWLRTKANKDDIQILQKNTIEPLLEFSVLGQGIINELTSHDYLLSQDRKVVLAELINALSITNLRAKHKAHTLSYLVGKRLETLEKNSTTNLEEHLESAQAVRSAAQKLVDSQEKNYRYPLESIGRKIEGGGSTSYDFGYLYPVSDLHFWQREEQQIIQNKYGPFFMSIWDIPRIIGVVD